METGVMETGVMETGVMETGVMETGVMETGVMETGVMETGVMDPVCDLDKVDKEYLCMTNTLNRGGFMAPTQLVDSLTVEVSQVWRHMFLTLVGGQGSLHVMVL